MKRILLAEDDNDMRQFLTRGIENVSNEWNLVCSAYNLKRLFRLKSPQQAIAVSGAADGAR